MNAHHYAEAILKASSGKNEEALDGIVSRTVALLERRGHLSLLPRIVHELEKLQKRGLHKEECLVRVAKADTEHTQAQAIEETVKSMGAENLPRRVEIDDTLVGGYEIRAQGKRVDRTYKRTLLQLYNTLLTNNKEA